jgi:hypothetical protein
MVCDDIKKRFFATAVKIRQFSGVKVVLTNEKTAVLYCGSKKGYF